MRIRSPFFFCFVALTASACAPEGYLGGDDPAEYRVVVDVRPQPKKKLDLLFVVDNSRNMSARQDELVMSFGKLISHLEFARGGLPDLHVGLTSTDLGVGPHTGLVDCTYEGHAGRLLPPACDDLDGDRFIRHLRDPGGGYLVNYDGAITEVFECMAALGEGGCEYEQPLEAMETALDGTHPESLEFLRPDAVLGVVIVTDEDDCSAIDADLFDPDNGDFTHNDPTFRCFEEGVRCDGDDVFMPGERQGCAPKKDSRYVADVARFVEFMRGLKPDPRDLIVTGVMGDPNVVQVEVDFDGSPQLAPSCEDTSGVAAYPSVRLQNFVDQVEGGGKVASLCEPDTLTRPSREIRKALGTRCLDGYIRDMDPERAGRQPSCRVFLETDGGREQVFACDRPYTPGASSFFPCYTIKTGPEECGDFPTQLALAVHQGPERPSEALLDEHPLGLPGVRVVGECVVDEPR